jgi:hypothetical protein
VVEAQFESGFKCVGLPLWMMDSWEMYCISSCTAHLLHMHGTRAHHTCNAACTSLHTAQLVRPQGDLGGRGLGLHHTRRTGNSYHIHSTMHHMAQHRLVGLQKIDSKGGDFVKSETSSHTAVGTRVKAWQVISGWSSKQSFGCERLHRLQPQYISVVTRT